MATLTGNSSKQTHKQTRGIISLCNNIKTRTKIIPITRIIMAPTITTSLNYTCKKKLKTKDKKKGREKNREKKKTIFFSVSKPRLRE